MSIEVRHLRHFVAVAEELHFARAAARVGIEQSPLSQSIREFEARLGITLFHRTTRATRLTSSGELFLNDARHVLASIERMRRAARDVAAGKKGRLRVGLCAEVLPVRVADLIARFRAASPTLELEIADNPSREQISDLHIGQLDLCIGLSAINDEDLSSTALWQEPLIAWMTCHETATHATVWAITRRVEQLPAVTHFLTLARSVSP
jgi:DNA-binding transcriptional LysR family regulator